ncbi:hypothetical protein [Planococcus sp. MB-3u-03]|uniref:hypothetical protein n=1 Tax=Planococcus sp. MB-3u-03 TaxID=2058136 RepID=UPI001E2BCBC4|nr:hypothetical protein [Planococcus sp. MB-3u-03]
MEVLGLVEDVRRIRTKKAMRWLLSPCRMKPVASVTLFPKEYAQYNEMLDKDALLEIQEQLKSAKARRPSSAKPL